jgi:outer membrane protein assembly factor BamB
MLSCLDAATGKVLWRKDDIKGKPRFFTSSSPIVLGGVCIAQLGGESGGAIVAYDLASGTQKWKWADDGTAYASPMLLTVADTKGVVAETARNIVAINAEDGKFLWKTPFAVSGRGYNAVTPMVDGQTVIYAGDGKRGAKAVKVEKKGSELTATQLWSNPDASCRYNTPVLKDGLLYGITENDRLFCVNTRDGKTAWTTSLKRGGGYGSVVDAGSALVALNPSGEMVVFEPGGKEFKQLANYKVAASGTYAYPILSGNRVFIKDKDAVTLWTVD